MKLDVIKVNSVIKVRTIIEWLGNLSHEVTTLGKKRIRYLSEKMRDNSSFYLTYSLTFSSPASPLLAQRPITLVLMMINSCSYGTKFQICDQDLSRCVVSTKDFKSSFGVARADSRACASRPHQVLKRSLAHWIIFGPSQEGEEASSEDLQEKT